MHPTSLPSYDPPRIWNEEEIFPNHPLYYVYAFLDKYTLNPMHTHSFYEINIVLRGEGWHYIGDQVHPARRGCVLTIPPGILHGYYSEQELTVYNFLIRREFFERYREEIRTLPGSAVLFEIEPYLRAKITRSIFATLSEPQIQEIYPNLSQLLHCCEGCDAGHAPLNNALALLITGYLSGQFLSSRPIAHDNKGDTAAILYVMEYLHRHYGEKITVDVLAKQANLSRTAFYQHFFELNHCSVIQYLTQYRLQQSLTLLANTASSIADIAQECGFYDSSHYIRTFSRKYHMTPQQYREKQNGEISGLLR